MRKRSNKTFTTKFPGHQQPVDDVSCRLSGSSQRRLLAKANKLLGETLIENQPEPHTVIDDRVEADMIGSGKPLRPLWHGRG
jgi:hypothetical protein